MQFDNAMCSQKSEIDIYINISISDSILSHKNNININDKLIEEKIYSPVDLDKNTNSYLGSLYGTSSNDMFSSFLRHPNFSRKLKNVFFCGGSVHPGGGIPLCILSSKIISELIEN